MITQIYSQLDSDELLSKVTECASKKNINSAVIRAVFTKCMGGEWEYLIGSCEIGLTGDDADAIYSNCAFICKSVNNFDLSLFLTSLKEGGYLVSASMPPIIALSEHKLNWSEKLISSCESFRGFPVRKYSTKINDKSSFNESILLGFDMEFHLSSGEYLKNFMEIVIPEGVSYQ